MGPGDVKRVKLRNIKRGPCGLCLAVSRVAEMKKLTSRLEGGKRFATDRTKRSENQSPLQIFNRATGSHRSGKSGRRSGDEQFFQCRRPSRGADTSARGGAVLPSEARRLQSRGAEFGANLPYRFKKKGLRG